jgi:hypothetical protein
MKMKMKNMLATLVFALVALSAPTQASATAILFDNGTFKFTGDNYLDSSNMASISGIGRVTTITQGSNIIWSAGDLGQYLNFVFSGFDSSGSVPTAPFWNFAATGGAVDFYLTNIASSFNAALAPVAGAAQIVSDASSLFMSTSAVGTTYGTANGLNGNYSSTGFLDVTGGDYFAQLHTQSVWTGVTFADLAFGLVGSANNDALINSGYEYVSSANLTGASAIPVPEPTMLMLMGLGVLAFAFSTQKKNNGNEAQAFSALA